jgi:hypothetical protein
MVGVGRRVQGAAKYMTRADIRNGGQHLCRRLSEVRRHGGGGVTGIMKDRAAGGPRGRRRNAQNIALAMQMVALVRGRRAREDLKWERRDLGRAVEEVLASGRKDGEVGMPARRKIGPHQQSWRR